MQILYGKHVISRINCVLPVYAEIIYEALAISHLHLFKFYLPQLIQSFNFLGRANSDYNQRG